MFSLIALYLSYRKLSAETSVANAPEGAAAQDLAPVTLSLAA